VLEKQKSQTLDMESLQIQDPEKEIKLLSPPRSPTEYMQRLSQIKSLPDLV